MAKRKARKPAAVRRKARTIKAPDFIMPLIAIIIIAVIVVGVFALSVSSRTPTGNFQAFVSSCEEYDSGLDAAVYGVTIGSTAKSTIISEDYCRSEKILVEYWCDGDEMKSAPIECKNSCMNGMCLEFLSEE